MSIRNLNTSIQGTLSCFASIISYSMNALDAIINNSTQDYKAILKQGRYRSAMKWIRRSTSAKIAKKKIISVGTRAKKINADSAAISLCIRNLRESPRFVTNVTTREIRTAERYRFGRL